MSEVDLSSPAFDQEQVKFMLEEFCMLVNEEDEITGSGSKKFCHLMENIDKGIALHRAFSVFLFDKENRLLLQQRADNKITFPAMWTNTCCSHPLHNIPNEREGVHGVKLAAIRKLEHELNIPPSEVPYESFKFLARILYKAASDGVWGEHEMDYILFIKVDSVSVTPNPQEVKDFRFVTEEELKELIEEASKGNVTLTPWFKLISDSLLFPWWRTLARNPSVLTSDERIHRL